MATIFINGLYFDGTNNRGVTVNIFDNKTVDNSFGSLIFTGNSDESGVASGNIDNEFIGKEIILSIIHPGFRPLQTKLNVTELGVFYTVRLDFDRNYISHDISVSNLSIWNSQSNYFNAQTELQRVIRKFKFENYVVKYVHYFLATLSIILGVISPFPYNLVLAIVFLILGEILAPYVIGLKPFWRRNKS